MTTHIVDYLSVSLIIDLEWNYVLPEKKLFIAVFHFGAVLIYYVLSGHKSGRKLFVVSFLFGGTSEEAFYSCISSVEGGFFTAIV